MNLTTRNELLDILKLLKEIKLGNIAAEVYPTLDRMEKELLNGEFTIQQLVIFYYRLIQQFKERLEQTDYAFLPTQYYCIEIDSTSGADSLSKRITSLLGIKDHKNFSLLATDIKWLIQYQMAFGFWDRSVTKVHDVKTIDLKAKETEINTLTKIIQNQMNLVSESIKKIESKEDSLVQLVKQKTEELNTIGQSLEIVRSQTTDINNYWQTGTKLDSEMKTLFDTQRNALDEIKRQISQQAEEFQNIKKEVNEQKEELNKKFESADVKLNEFNQETELIKQRKEKVLENEKKILDLLGMSADAALGGRFNDREKKLLGGLTFWKYAVPIMTAITVFWVIAVFTWMKFETEDIWVSLAINLLKTTPAFILLGFVFKQYTKERNLQEEYAFKSAVAMTVTVYSDLLKNGDTPDNKSRQEMLLEAIRQVYSSPKIHVENKEKIFSFGTKNLTEAVKNLTEVVKK